MLILKHKKKHLKIKAYPSPDIDIIFRLQLLVIVYGWWAGGDGVCGVAHKWSLAAALAML